MKRNKNKNKSLVRRLLLIGLFVVVGIILCMVGINTVVTIKANKYIVTNESDLPKGVDAIIVLGAGLLPENQPGTVLKDRLDTAIKLYKDGYSDRLLMSGDHGDDYHNEVRVMKDYAVSQGVPEDDVFMDHAGFSTYETMVRADRVFQVKTCIIVTQEYHMYRSVYIARSVGLNACGYVSDIHVDELKYIPLEMREFLARVKAFFDVIIKPDPEYLGDPIPISGNGSATDD
ncbi:MAG: YdcF family protein [Eubacterium sp.]|nr:YdcF family protein [Eubacterium sp.]